MSRAKIKQLKELKKIVGSLRKKGKAVVFTNGCFDILHFGHLAYLEEAKKNGAVLIVAINSDASVRRLKGAKRPIVNQKDRSRLIAGMACVDYVVIFSQDTPRELIEELKPDVLVKGADWKKNNIVGADLVESRGGKVVTIKLANGRSTTNIIEKIIRLRP